MAQLRSKVCSWHVSCLIFSLKNTPKIASSSKGLTRTSTVKQSKKLFTYTCLLFTHISCHFLPTLDFSSFNGLWRYLLLMHKCMCYCVCYVVVSLCFACLCLRIIADNLCLYYLRFVFQINVNTKTPNLFRFVTQ